MHSTHFSLLRTWGGWCALGLLVVYASVFPGSTITVALDRVPAWGIWFGGALLFVQGSMLWAWLAWRYGARGLAAGLALGTLAFAVEYIGVTTGFPFGRYVYTDVLQPQIASTVPLAICSAWVLVVPASYAVAQRITPSAWGRHGTLFVSATLIMLLDMQIETVATRINSYWIWADSSAYYGVPVANFVAWWVVGLVLSTLLMWLVAPAPAPLVPPLSAPSTRGARVAQRALAGLPELMYLLSTLMFAVANLARGYPLAGAIGVAALAVVGALLTRGERGAALIAAARRTAD